jgi:MFS family permease
MPEPLRSHPLEAEIPSAEESRRIVLLLIAMIWYAGFAGAIPYIASPWIAKSFGLDQSAVARLFAWIALSALVSLGLSRMADKVGRRRVILWSISAMPICAIGAALSERLAAFVAFDIALSACALAAGASAIVVIAELLPIERRAQGQSYAGLAAALGAGGCVLLMPILVHFGWSWRWLLAITGAGVLLFPALARALPESARWERAASIGDTARTRFRDIFVPLYRRRSIALTICTLLANMCGEGITSWPYFHAVSVVGLSATAASTMMFLGGGVGLLGFPGGAWGSERFGRVPTVVWAGIGVGVGGLLFYWGPTRGFAHPALWLCVSLCLLNAVNNAVTVGSLSAVTELYPTSLRGTMIGWFTLIGSIGSLTAEVLIAVLTKLLGSPSIVIGWLGLLAIPGAILFGIFIVETRGLTLEASANEEAFDTRSTS